MMNQDDLIGSNCNLAKIIGDIPSLSWRGEEQSHDTFGSVQPVSGWN
jgi:hypothetical protein